MTAAAKDGGQAEVQKKADAEIARGYVGRKTDPRDNQEYSLQSGPESPGPAESDIRIHVDDLKED